MFYSVVVLALMVSVVMLMLFVLISLWVESSLDSVSPYECGFDGKSVTRMFFSYRFFLIAILFLIFDVEISLLLPLPFLGEGSNTYMIMSVFILLLLLGLVYEIKIGSLEWL